MNVMIMIMEIFVEVSLSITKLSFMINVYRLTPLV